MTKVVHVAVGIIKNKNGELLLTSHPKGKGWAGWWEFPGGKVEQGETPENALIRELQEEVSIKPTEIQPWLQRRFDYPKIHDAEAKTVLLYFFFVTAWQGDAIAMEGQDLSWQLPNKLTVEPVLPANAPIMKALALPPVYAISNVLEMGEADFLVNLKWQLERGLKLIQLCEKNLSRQALISLAKNIVSITRPYQARVLIQEGASFAKAVGADGVHFSSVELMKLKTKPNGLFIAASCHSLSELAHAEKLGLDFVVLSPIKHNLSHHIVKPLGWKEFAKLTEGMTVPVYALGGMQLNDIPQALSSGARGVAMQQGAWAGVDIGHT